MLAVRTGGKEHAGCNAKEFMGRATINSDCFLVGMNL